MSTNDFLQFCSTDTGSNLLTESEYTASADRVSGNKPGVASAKLNNRALRQANYITSQIAQLAADTTANDVLDDATPAKLLAILNSTFTRFAPRITTYASGSGTHNVTYIFLIATGSATAGATYTNNAVTYTVKDTVASGKTLTASGSGAPLVAGTLTKASGTGDSTITFYSVRAPLFIKAQLVGAGGGGSGSGGPTQGNGGVGGNTTFGTTLLVANGGSGATGSTGAGGAGGTANLNGASGRAMSGGAGTGATFVNNLGTVAPSGGTGGNSSFGGAGAGGTAGGNPGGTAAANSGGGGGGGGVSLSVANAQAGGGGGAGGFIDALLEGTTLLSTYAYAVGTAGTAGSAGTNGALGGVGSAGFIRVEEYYQ